MNKFVNKKIETNDNGIGQELRSAREEKGLSIENISGELQIRKEYLTALESEDFNSLPKGLYGKQFLKEYASFLELDHKNLVKIFSEGERYYKQAEDNIFFTKKIKKHKFLVFPKIIRNIVIILVVLSFFLYLGIYLKRIVIPPYLEVTSPNDNITTNQSYVYVIGKTEPEALVIINGETILIKKEGDFNEKVNLKNGINIINISAKKKYSRKNNITKQILVE